MLATVQFDNQFVRQTGKIDDIAPDRRLTAALAALNLPVSQVAPENLFRFSLVFSEVSGEVCC